MMKPHKHAELIKAWADGAEIQMYCKGVGYWIDHPDPAWVNHLEYRIKPELEPEPETEIEIETEWMYIYNNAEEGKTWITPIAPSYYGNINYLTCMGKIKVYK